MCGMKGLKVVKRGRGKPREDKLPRTIRMPAKRCPLRLGERPKLRYCAADKSAGHGAGALIENEPFHPDRAEIGIGDGLIAPRRGICGSALRPLEITC